MSEWSGRAGGPAFSAPGRPARANSVVAAVLSAAFVAATVLLAVVAHRGAPGSAGSLGVAPGGVAPGQNVQVGGGPTGTVPHCCDSPAPTPTNSSPRPLDPEAINRTFQVYMNALLHHDLRALKSATCPRLRHTEVGVALHGKYVHAWRGKPYNIAPGLSYVTIRAVVRFTDPATGGNAGRAIYSWHVERAHRGHYYVCGFLS